MSSCSIAYWCKDAEEVWRSNETVEAKYKRDLSYSDHNIGNDNSCLITPILRPKMALQYQDPEKEMLGCSEKSCQSVKAITGLRETWRLTRTGWPALPIDESTGLFWRYNRRHCGHRRKIPARYTVQEGPTKWVIALVVWKLVSDLSLSWVRLNGKSVNKTVGRSMAQLG